ncbi:MAG: autotransporter-associated beta strand repeat-containing protein [Planctomycetia bacterium]|nr:autotransporter-associated beta strand repeat-containing protein [Planctomycetia bacterium]
MGGTTVGDAVHNGSGLGGALFVLDGNLTVSGSTFSGNSGAQGAKSVYFHSPTSVTLNAATNTTLAGTTGPISITSTAINDTDSMIFNTDTNNTATTSISGTTGVTKLGAGILKFAASNTYAGPTLVSTGTLQLGASQIIPDGAGKGDVTVNGTFDLNTFSETINGLAGGSGGVVDTVAGGTPTLTVGNSTAPFSGLIKNTLGLLTLIKTGSGTETLTGVNTFGGKTTIAAGAISVNNVNATATGDQALGKNADLDLGVAATSSGQLMYTGAAGTLAKNINALGNGSDTVQNSGTGLLTLSGILTKTGTVLTLKGGANGITVSGVIQGNTGLPNSDLIIDGGITTLTNANTYDGPTSIIDGGTLNANVTDALPTANGRSAVSLDQSGTGSSKLALGASQSIASLTAAASSTVDLNGNLLTVGAPTGSTTFAGVISHATGSLTKDGGSTQVLSGANTYGGATLIGSGVLALSGSGSIGNSSSIEIGSTADFDLTGVATSYSMLASQPITFDIDPTGAGSSGLLDASGKILNIANGDVLFNLLNPLDDPFYVLAKYGTLSGAQFLSVTAPAGYTINYAYAGGTEIALVQSVSSVPEPGTFALAVLGLVGLGLIARRRARTR